LKLSFLGIRIEYRMSKLRLFLICSFFFITGLTGSFYIAQAKPELVVPDVMVALEQAIVEVEKGCPMLLEYATMLETENARLNRVMKTMVIPTGSEPTSDCGL